MIKETSILDEIQAIRRALMDAKVTNRAEAHDALMDYMCKKHKLAGRNAVVTSELYKNLLTHPAMKHILEYLEL